MPMLQCPRCKNVIDVSTGNICPFCGTVLSAPQAVSTPKASRPAYGAAVTGLVNFGHASSALQHGEGGAARRDTYRADRAHVGQRPAACSDSVHSRRDLQLCRCGPQDAEKGHCDRGLGAFRNGACALHCRGTFQITGGDIHDAMPEM